MVEERITEVEDPETGRTHTTHTTVINDGEPRRGGGGSGLLILLVIVALAAIGFFIWQSQSNSEIAKDNAVAEAASDVGDAAQQAGEAVEDAANEVTNNE